MSKEAAPLETLRESVVKDALKSLNWTKFEKHLVAVDIDADDAGAIVAQLRRSGDFLLKRPDAKREAARASFVAALETHLADHVGEEAVDELAEAMAMIGRIEAGYGEILRTLDATVAAKLLPEVQVSAALQRAAFSFDKLMRDVRADMSRRKELTVQSFRITRDDGSTYSPDGILAAINAASTMTLLLLGHRNKWFDANKYLTLPALARATDDEVYKAGLAEVLAMSWRHWERMEQRCRYLEGELEVFRGDEIPAWAPEGSETAIEYRHICEPELYDHLANHRLNDRMVQTFQEMLQRTDLKSRASGIEKPLALPPAAFVSAQEGHAGVSLSEILGYSIVDDKETPGGIRLVEWLRGYAVLQQLAEQSYAQDGEGGLCATHRREDLIAILDRLGLKNGAAEGFIDLASLTMSSRDLFDQPLIRMQNGDLMLFGPGILNADPARITLSAIANRGEQLSRKGKTFEAEMLKFFQEEGFDPKAFKFKRDGEEYEYDVLVAWDDHVFIFECKNRTLSGNNPVSAYYFALEMDQAIRQVRRLADGLELHPDVVLERTGIDLAGKTIVPCVLNSLPYAAKVGEDGVYLSDASSLKRFFQERYFHLVRPHRLKKKNATVLHRTAMKSLWSGDKATVADLVAYLADPLPLQIAAAHTGRTSHGFGLGGRTVVMVDDLAYQEMTTESISTLCGVDPKSVRRDARTFTRALDRVQRRHEKRAIVQAERAWRSQQRRRPAGKV